MDIVDKHLDAVLRASGSALRYYTMQKPLDEMRAAMRAAMAPAAAAAPQTFVRLSRALGNPKQVETLEGETVEDALIRMACDALAASSQKPAPLQGEYPTEAQLVAALKAASFRDTHHSRKDMTAALIAARGAAQAAPAMDAKQLGDAVAKWLGCETTTPRGDTGEPERGIDVSVERLGFAVAATLKTVAAPVAEDAARYRWLFDARTTAQTETVSGTVFNPVPQDEILAYLQGFYVCKERVDALVDAARAQAAQQEEGGPK